MKTKGEHYSYEHQSLKDEEPLPDLFVLGTVAPGRLPKEVCKTETGFVVVLLLSGISTSLTLAWMSILSYCSSHGTL